MIPGVKKSEFTFSFLQGYLAILLKHARLILLLVLLSACLGLFYWVYAKPVYYARALIHVRLLARPADDNVDYKRESLYYTLQQQFQSDHILERTARLLGIAGRHESIKKRYMRKIIAKYNSESNLEVEIYPYTSNLAQTWPDAMFEAFSEYRAERRMESRKRKIKSWSREQQQVQAKLDEIDQRKKKLQEDMAQWEMKMGLAELNTVPDLLVAVRDTLTLFTQIDKKLQGPKLDRNSRLALLERAEREATVPIGAIVPGLSRRGRTDIYPQKGSEVIVLPGMVKTSDESWARLEERLDNLTARLEILLKIYRDAHPDVIKLKKEVAQVEKRLANDAKAMLNRFYVEHERLKSKEKALEAKLERLKTLTAKAELYQSALQRIEVTKLPWELMLANLKKGLDRIDIEGDKELYALKGPEILATHSRPVSPNLWKLGAAVFGLSLLLGLGIPFLLEYLDHTLSVAEDAAKQLGLPSLGIVPKVAEILASAEIGENGNPRIIIETFRMLRTNLVTNSELTDRRQVIMITSALPREGKTAVACNLAMAFANLGERTLLADMDLRRGHLEDYFNQAREPGLAELLINKEPQLAGCLRATAHDNLNFLPGGQRVDDVAELLGSETFAELLNELRHNYDRIIIDTPPALGLAETSGMLPLVDGVVLVIWSNYTPVEQAKSAISLLTANGANFYGFVLNQLDLKCPTNYFRYYYYSDYYYSGYHS